MDNVWHDHAARLMKKYGYEQARAHLIRDRDSNTPGTATYAFHNAAFKALEQIRRDSYDGAEYEST